MTDAAKINDLSDAAFDVLTDTDSYAATQVALHFTIAKTIMYLAPKLAGSKDVEEAITELHSVVGQGTFEILKGMIDTDGYKALFATAQTPCNCPTCKKDIH